MSLDTFRQKRNEAVKERPMSAPSRVASDEIFTQHRNQLVVTVQIENSPGAIGIQGEIELLRNTTELGRSQHHIGGIGGKIVRSSSLNENPFASLTKCHHNLTQWSAQRSRPVPTITTHLNEPKKRTTFDELIDDNGLSVITRK